MAPKAETLEQLADNVALMVSSGMLCKSRRMLGRRCCRQVQLGSPWCSHGHGPYGPHPLLSVSVSLNLCFLRSFDETADLPSSALACFQELCAVCRRVFCAEDHAISSKEAFLLPSQLFEHSADLPFSLKPPV